MTAIAWLETLLAEQRRYWPVWLAIAFGAGIAIYFSRATEPPLMVGLLALPAIGIVSMLVRRWDVPFSVCLILAAVAAGFLAGQVRTVQISGPMLPAPLERALFVGVVDQIELLPTGQRVTLRAIDIKDLPRAVTPARIRLKVVSAQPELRVGQKVGGVGSLNAPGGPAVPGAFDFRRQAFFDDLGAIGFSFGRLKILREPDESRIESWSLAISDKIAATRAAIAQRIRSQLPDSTSAVAIALTVGDQTALRAADLNAMRDSGLAHLLSISGLHIGLAAGLFFFGLRLVLSFVPRIALRYPVKKWAAIVAIVAAALYAGLAGWTTPTQRSLIMAGIAFLAIVLDRSPISLQLVAWAAFLVLLFQPESLLGASFQMSFAAVFALVVVFETIGPWFAGRRQAWGEGASWDAKLFGALGNIFIWLGMTVVTSFIAGLATLPYAVFHFDRMSTYGIAANAIAVPLTGFWIMPTAAMSLLLMPFGLEGWALQAMGWGCDLLLLVARWVADWPGAIFMVPAPPSLALLIISVGLLWLGLVHGRWRWLAIAPILGALAAAWVAPRPDILVSPSGRLVAFRAPDGDLVLSANRAERLVRETWLRRNAQLRFDDIGDLTGAESWLRCNERYCDYVAQRRVRVFLRDAAVDASECAAFDLVILAQSSGKDICPQHSHMLDHVSLTTRGAHAIFLSEDQLSIIDSATHTGNRPWTRSNSLSDDAGAGVVAQ